MKFIHAADIHLDSPLRGLERYEGAPVDAVRSASREALANLVQLAVDERADVLLIAGDLFDGDWKDYNTGLFLVAQLQRLRAVGVRTFMISGNHDAASRITRSLRLPEGVTLFSTDCARTVVLDDLEVAIHGQGYSTRAVDCDLSAEYPDPIAGRFNIGLLHTSADGREGHETYAPCSVTSLSLHGYDYWALGHVHRREVLSRDPWIVFPGNIQGRHVREPGAKGATLVTVEDRAVARVEHHDLDVVRWEVCEVDVAGAATPEAVVDLVLTEVEALQRANGDRVLAVRLQVIGSSPVHEALSRDREHWVNELRAAALGLGGSVWLEKVEIGTTPALAPGQPGIPGEILAGLERTIQEVREDPCAIEEFVQEFADLRGKLPPEYRRGDDAIDLGQAMALSSRFERVEQLLASRLISEGETDANP